MDGYAWRWKQRTRVIVMAGYHPPPDDNGHFGAVPATSGQWTGNGSILCVTDRLYSLTSHAPSTQSRSEAASRHCLRRGSTSALRRRGFNPALDHRGPPMVVSQMGLFPGPAGPLKTKPATDRKRRRRPGPSPGALWRVRPPRALLPAGRAASHRLRSGGGRLVRSLGSSGQVGCPCR